jgi:hypothetical protein
MLGLKEQDVSEITIEGVTLTNTGKVLRKQITGLKCGLSGRAPPYK